MIWEPEQGWTHVAGSEGPNPNGILLPGQFARVRADYDTLEDAVVVPRRAITELQGRFRVFVVGGDKTVEIRDVTLGPIKDNDQIVTDGLKAGEKVIIEGLQKVRPGMVVKPQLVRPGSQNSPLQET